MKNKIFFKTLLALILGLSLFAGWVMEESYGGKDKRKKRIIYIQNNLLKLQESGFSTTFNLEENLLYLVNFEKGIYWKGSPEDMQKEINAFKNKILSQLSEQQRKVFEKKLNQRRDKKVSVKIVKTSEKTTILNFKAEKYKVFENGALKEILWISPDVDLSADIDIKKLIGLMQAVDKATGTKMTYRSTRQYKELFFKGYPLKIERSGQDGKLEIKVLKIERKTLPKTLFSVPTSFRRVTLFEVVKN